MACQVLTLYGVQGTAERTVLYKERPVAVQRGLLQVSCSNQKHSLQSMTSDNILIIMTALSFSGPTGDTVQNVPRVISAFRPRKW